jgi:glycosyltransferase involved in cell wall biosynthesis
LSYPMLDRVVAVSQGAADALCRLVPRVANRTTVLPNPLDIERIVRQSGEDLPVGAPHRYLLGMGRLSPEKGFDLLVRAYGGLVREGVEQDLVILGEGPERASLIQLTVSLGIADRVHLPGFAANPNVWLKRADAFVLSSYFEGFGLVLVEAMAVGTPVVAVNARGGGPREILADGEYGILVPHGEVEALVEGMRKLLGDAALARDFVRKGKDRAREYDVAAVIPAYAELFRQVQSC